MVRQTTDNCSALSMKWLLEQLNMYPGKTITNKAVSWQTSKGQHRSTITISEFTLNENGTGRLVILFQIKGRLVDQVIRLETSKPYYGGKRWWFICPYDYSRCLFLYNEYGSYGFGSRMAFELKYQSQNETVADRANRKLKKLQKKYGAPLWWENYFLKPKWMHYTTYARRLMELEKQSQRTVGHLLLGLDRIKRSM